MSKLKYAILISAVCLVGGAAQAAERPKGAHYTTQEINNALQYLGRCCQIGTARVLSDSGTPPAGVERREINIKVR